MQRQLAGPSARRPGAAARQVDVMNSLLRGEMAAGRTYDMVIAKFDRRPEAVELQRLRDEHAEAAAVLRERVRLIGGEPCEKPGIWATIAAAITWTARVFGPATALATLVQGEEHGIGQYENTLTDASVDHEDRDLIRYRLLPRCHNHVHDLERIMKAIE